MRLKYKIGMAIVIILLGICFMTYQSYALWVISLSGEENIVEVGCFEIVYEELSTSISLQNTYPMSDQKGLTTTPYTFKIKNNCTIDSKYNVTLNTLTTNGITKDKIKYAIVPAGKSTLTGTNLGLVTKLNTDISGLQIENLDESIIIASGSLKQNEEETYQLYLWLDETAGNEVMGKSFAASVNIISVATVIKETAVEYLTNLSNTSDNLIYDETADNNLRYIGANPNNYIDIGDRDADGNVIPWRIIGVMNNVGDGNGNSETRLKIIRSEDIGGYSWDTSSSNVNSGYGVNEWSQSDMMKLLNPGYESESIGGSLYWNRSSGNCYNGSNNANTACDFTSSGLSNDAKSHIGEALWHTGSNGSEEAYNNILTSKFYELEKSLNTGKICSSGSYCNDNVERTTSWMGLVGLMSPADYGYATSGGNNTNRETCLNTKLYSWDGTRVEECKNNDWLYNSSATEWTILPSAHSSNAYNVFNMAHSGYVAGSYDANPSFRARPVVYLKADTKITSGDGTLENIFVVD